MNIEITDTYIAAGSLSFFQILLTVEQASGGDPKAEIGPPAYCNPYIVVSKLTSPFGCPTKPSSFPLILTETLPPL